MYANYHQLASQLDVIYACTFRKKSNKGIHTPRQSLGQIIKKGLTGGQKFVPRSTHTSQMRQTQVQKVIE